MFISRLIRDALSHMRTTCSVADIAEGKFKVHKSQVEPRPLAHLFVLSNAGNQWAEDVTPETIKNDPIRMVILSADEGLEHIFSADENPFNPPEVFGNTLPLVRGELSDWRLVGVNIGDAGTYLIYVSGDDIEAYQTAQVCVLGKSKLLFTVESTKDVFGHSFLVEDSKKLTVQF